MKYADMLEEVQRRATKMIPSLRNLSYEEIFKRLGMFSLRRKRLSGDMIGVFKMIHGSFFCKNEDGRTRQRSLCLKIRRYVNANIGLYFFQYEL